MISFRRFVLLAALFALWTAQSLAQVPPENAKPATQSSAQEDEIRQLRQAVEELQAEVAALKAQMRYSPSSEVAGIKPASEASLSTESSPAQKTETQPPKEERPGLDFLRQTTIEFGLDGYYGYNFNSPIGRVNLLRAYDVSSNSFSLNQASFILKQDPDVSAGRRFGLRLDFQYGQATETLQGNSANELRPNVYRPVFQAFGTYVLPVGSGLTVDFGKWASVLGFEGNYTKDQMNYSRSFWFNFLPFYHMGVRTRYKFNDKLTVNYWLVNGAQQTEDFNGFKDQLIGVNVQPRNNLSWNLYYYIGQEHPDVTFFSNGGAPPNSPTQQGLPFQPIPAAPDGKLHIIDSYLSWHARPGLTLGAEGNYVIQRLFENSPPAHTDGGSLYARYQATRKIALAARSEYLSDRGGLFSGVTQALKEVTLTYDYKLAGNFLLRTEWRRDFSNKQFFLTDQLGILSNHQNTATMGLVWWWGNKEESW